MAALTTQQMLDEALEVRHQLMLGRSAVTVSSGGKSVTYHSTDLGRLDLYIASLRTQLGQPSGLSRPIDPSF